MNIKRIFPLIGIAIFLYILLTLDIQQIVSVFAALNPLYVLLSFCFLIPMVLLVNVGWQMVLKKHGIQVSFWYSLKNIFIGYFYGFITPGGLGGYARAFYLRDASGAPLQKCLVNIVLFNTMDYLAFLCLGLLGGLILSSHAPHMFSAIVLIFIVLISVVYVFFRKQTGKRMFERLLKARILNTVKDKYGDQLDTLYDELPKSSDLLFPFFVSLFGWTLWFSVLYLISLMFSLQVSFIMFFAVVATANVIASIPISIYGLGTREAGLIALFSLFGVSSELVVAFSLFWFMLSWVVPSGFGALVTLWESKRKSVV